MFRIEERWSWRWCCIWYTDQSINQCLELKKGGDGAVFGIPINQCVELSRKKSTTDIPPDEVNQLINFIINPSSSKECAIEIKSILIKI